jgi:hypothetical protein
LKIEFAAALDALAAVSFEDCSADFAGDRLTLPSRPLLAAFVDIEHHVSPVQALRSPALAVSDQRQDIPLFYSCRTPSRRNLRTTTRRGRLNGRQKLGAVAEQPRDDCNASCRYGLAGSMSRRTRYACGTGSHDLEGSRRWNLDAVAGCRKWVRAGRTAGLLTF